MQDNNGFNGNNTPPYGYNNKNSTPQNPSNGYNNQYTGYQNNSSFQNQQQYYPPQYQQTQFIPVREYDTDVPERKKIRKLFNGVGLALISQVVLMLILSLSLSFILDFIGYGGEYKEDGVTWIIHFWEEIACAWMPAFASIIMFFIYNALTGYKPKELFSAKSVTPKFVITAIVITLFLQQVSILLMSGLSVVLYGMGYEVLFNYEMSTDAPTQIASFFSSVILAPVAEELFFRGIVLRNVAKVSQRFAIFFSAMIFGLMHGNPYQMILGFLIGIVLGYITVKTGSIIPAILCHMANNLVASIPELFSLIDESLYEPISYGFMALFLIAGLAVFVIVLVTGKVKMPEYTLYHKHRTTPIILTSIAVYIAVGIYIFEIITSISRVPA